MGLGARRPWSSDPALRAAPGGEVAAVAHVPLLVFAVAHLAGPAGRFRLGGRGEQELGWPNA